jgi:hypothetical protein
MFNIGLILYLFVNLVLFALNEGNHAGTEQYLNGMEKILPEQTNI